jgi:hypothetical protein
VGHIKRLCCSGVLGLNAPHSRSPHRLDNVRRRPFLDYLLAFRPAAMARSDIAPAACSSAIVLPRCARWLPRRPCGPSPSASIRHDSHERIKAALQAARARGVVLGGHREQSDTSDRASELARVFAQVATLSVRAAAEELTRRGVPTPSGGRWHPTQVARVRRRLAV